MPIKGTRGLRIFLWCLSPVTLGIFLLLPYLPFPESLRHGLAWISPLLVSLILLFPITAMFLRTLEKKKDNFPPEMFLVKIIFISLLYLMALFLMVMQWVMMAKQ